MKLQPTCVVKQSSSECIILWRGAGSSYVALTSSVSITASATARRVKPAEAGRARHEHAPSAAQCGKSHRVGDGWKPPT